MRAFSACCALAIAAALPIAAETLPLRPCGYSPAQARPPYRIGVLRDGWIAGAGALAIAGAAIVEGSTPNMTAEEIEALSRDDINSFDRPAASSYSEDARVASNVLIAALVAAPLALAADPAVRRDWPELSTLYLETIAFAAAIPSYAKASFERIRPQVYNPEAPMEIRLEDEPRRSFFSRHASIAFASAVFLSTVHGAYHPDSRARPYVWTGSLLAAAAIGAARCEAGKHFPTDVIAGAVVGSAVGWIIPRLHRSGGGDAVIVLAPRGNTIGIAVELRI